MPSETPITASLMLFGLGLKLRRRWSNDICWVRWGVGIGEAVVAEATCGGRVWDSSSMEVEGSMVVAEVVIVLVLLVVDDVVAECSC